ncbi:polysaccharide deacetylase family protein [Clostridium sp. E02]|uniref:polysaccharide deacetylase family protein n=1 Tax=Clostridium sp. E02 TaxID=2487134 RepID=UPI000F53A713|nr:polysaccharide deacetylase family protein [Clostridium sp. E02]
MKRKVTMLSALILSLTLASAGISTANAQEVSHAEQNQVANVNTAAYRGNVYLTFDDGPNNATSNTLVNNLKKAGCYQATFFVWGSKIQSNQWAWNVYLNSGYSLQNHSWSHAYMNNWSYQQVYNDLQKCNQAIQNAGKPRPTKVRLPYLYSNQTIRQACSALRLSIVTPTVYTNDWNGASTNAIISSCNNLRSGGNPLMHDSYQNTVSAIPAIVNNLKNQGFGFAQY